MKMNNQIATNTLFRVQGGIFPCRSRDYIKIVNGNKIRCSKTREIYIGDREHMTYFLFKRLGINSINSMHDEIEKYGVHVLEMHVPYWLPYLIEKYSVDQFRNKDKTYPRLVDKKIPGQSYQIPRMWIELLEASCVHGVDNEIKEKKDIYDILLPKELPIINQEELLDLDKISEIIYKCKIKESDINSLRDIWGLKIADMKGERE